jgi:cytochrome c-type biogenesis protein CcmF
MLLKPLEKNNLLLISKRASNFAMATLSIGIGLGSWWAYRELGWGGFWFFDPVENISLLPWLCGIALHHFLILSIKEEKYVRLTVLLSIFTFLLTLYGMFFVRSGIISSVHSFAFSPERGLYIFLICLIISALSFILFICKQNALITKSLTTIKHRIMLLGNILWLLSLIILLIGIIYPIYYSYFYKIEVAIDTEYYHIIFIPLIIPILLFASISPQLGRNIKKHLIHIIPAILGTLFINYFKSLGIISGSVIFCSIYLMSQMTIFLLIQTNYCRMAASPSVLALFFGHFGFAILALSIALNTIFSFNVEFIGKVGHVVRVENLSVTLQNIKFADGPNYFRQIAEFSVHDQHNNIVILNPENRLYKVENTISAEANIYSYLTHDLYAIISKVDGQTVHGQIYYRPFISFIWFAVFVIVLGFVFNKNITPFRKSSLLF